MVATTLLFTILSFMLLTVNGAPVRGAITRVANTAMRNVAQSAKSVPRTPLQLPTNILSKGQPPPLSRLRIPTGNVPLTPPKPQESLLKSGGTKILGGALVGFGALGAQALDKDDDGPSKREIQIESETLERRNPPLRVARLGNTVIKQAGQAVRTSGRQMTRIPRPAIPQPAPQVQPPVAQSGGGTLKWTGLALTAGVGEYWGQKLMNGATDRLHADDGSSKRRRELQDDLDELVLREESPEVQLTARTFPVAASALRTASRNAASTAFRSASMSTSRTAATSGLQGARNAAVTTAKTAFMGGAALAAGVTEGVIQNTDKQTQKKLWEDPVGSITKMIPATKGIFGQKI